MEKQRIVFIDYLRVIACFLVMLVHASENFYADVSTGLAGPVAFLPNEANRFWVAFYDGFIARSCVPLFMIASAFLLVPLKDGVTMTQFYKRRFLRVLPPFLVFSLLYCFLPILWGNMTIEDSMNDLALLPWNFVSMAGHLWFIYPLISLYLFAPIISPWLKIATPKDELIYISLFVVSTFIPFIHRFITPELWGECFWNGFSMLWYCSGYLGYLVLAHYIRVHLTWDAAKRFKIGLLCALIGSAFTGWAFWYEAVPGLHLPTPTVEWAWEFCTPNVLLQTFGVFLMLSAIKDHKVPAIITDISKRSFGMYLMHMFFLSNIATYVLNGDQANPIFPVWISIPVIAICSYICSYATSKILSYLPYSKYIVG